MVLVMSQFLGPAIMLLMVLIKGRDAGARLVERAGNQGEMDRDPDELGGRGEGAMLEMSNLGKEVTLGGAPITRENKHLHMASSFRPTQNVRGGRSKRDKGATEPPSSVKAATGPPTTSPFHASAHTDHTKEGLSLPSSNVRVNSSRLLASVKPDEEIKLPPSSTVRVNSSGLLAVVKPDEEIKLDVAKDLPSPPPPAPSNQPGAVGWTEHVDPATNSPYWSNDETGETTWHRP